MSRTMCEICKTEKEVSNFYGQMICDVCKYQELLAKEYSRLEHLKLFYTDRILEVQYEIDRLRGILEDKEKLLDKYKKELIDTQSALYRFDNKQGE